MNNLVVGQWYVDSELGHYFKLLAVGDKTLEVVDLFADRRTVNRLLWESAMTPTKRVPLPKGGVL